MKVLIAGGGIGGLTAALCCLHFGHDVTIFEKATDFGEIGAGIQVPPNAMKVFEALGLGEKIAENAFKPEAIEARMGESGRNIFTIPLMGHSLERWGSPYLHIHRADYIKALKRAVLMRAPDAIYWGASVDQYHQLDDHITVNLTDGRMFSGDVLIGADGIKSIIRAQMLGPDNPVFTGNIAWRVVVPVEALGTHAPNPTACVWMGSRRHGVTYRLRRGELANFVGVVEQKNRLQEGWTERGSQDELLSDFKDWHPVITKLIEAADPNTLFRWALFDRAPLSHWTDGRAVLLGDAAHAMLPFMAQGAAMAVEDSWVLAREISQSNRSLQESLQKYQNYRFKRTTRAQYGSRANMKTFHQHTPFGRLKTYGPMWVAGKFAPVIIHKRMDWLYSHNVTEN